MQCLVIVAGVGFILPAYADVSNAQQIRIGVLQHDTPIGQNRIEPGTDLNVEWIGPTYQLPDSLQPYTGFGIRPVLGYTGNFGGARTEEVYGAMGFDLLPSQTYEFLLSLGLSAHDGELDPDNSDRLALGQRVLFYASFEGGFWWHHHGLFLFFQHSSNGFLSGRNDGINNLGIRYGYRF